MPWSKQRVLPLDDLRLHRQLLAGQPQRLTGERLGDAGELEHHPSGLDHCHPALGRSLAGAHPRLGRLLRVALVGEDVDPDLAAPLDLARHRDAGRLDLPVRDPAGIERLEPVVAELHGRLPARDAAAAATVHLAELRLLRHQHGSAPLLHAAVAGALALGRLSGRLVLRRRSGLRGRLGGLLLGGLGGRLLHGGRLLLGRRLLEARRLGSGLASAGLEALRGLTRARTPTAPASRAAAAPPLPYRPEALAVGAAAPPALARGAEPFDRAAAAPASVLVAQPHVGLAVALGHDLALVDPDLDADAAGGRLGFGEAVVDVRPDRVQRYPSLAVGLAPAHLAAAEPAGALDLDAGCARADRGGQRPLHRPPEGDPVGELLGDRLGDELRVELGTLDLVDVDVDVLVRQRVQVAAQGVHLDARLADQDVGEPRVRELAVDVLADPDVLEQVVRELLLARVPVGLPVVDDPHAEPAGMDLLAHYSSLSSSAGGASAGAGRGARVVACDACASSIVMWQVRLRIRATRPRARARQRFSVGPSSA